MAQRIFKPQPVIVIDTREQMPYVFKNVPTVKDGLKTGDYSLMGYLRSITIERKSLQDFVSSLTNDRERFEKECERLSQYTGKFIVVEATYEQISQPYSFCDAHPNSILGSMAGLMLKYGINVVLVGDRKGGADCFKLFKEY